MFHLQGCKISSMPMFTAHFDFKELYALLKSEDAYLFTEFAQSCMPLSSARTRLLGINDIYGNKIPNTGAIRCVAHPELCLEMVLDGDSPVFVKCEGLQNVKVSNIDKLKENVFLYSQIPLKTVMHIEHPQKAESWKGIKEAIYAVIDEITENGERLFSYEGAAEFYLYLLLHMVAGVLPDKQDSVRELQEDLNKTCPVSSDKLESMKRFDCNDPVLFPFTYYTGEEPNGKPLSVVEIHNPHAEEITVKIGHTILFRTIPPQGSVYALRKGAELVSFLPRFRCNGDMAIVMQDGSLFNVWQGHTEKIRISVTHPVVWAHSREYGTFVIDRDGRLDNEAAWPEKFPDKEVVYADAFGLDYCMLLSDGKVLSRLQKKKWDSVLGFSLGLNCGIAINENREPVLSDGTVLSGFRAAQARAYSGHYICLNESGEIKTDSMLNLREKVYGISICNKGYVAAFEKKICLIGFDNTFVNEWSIAGVTELEADRTGILYYDSYNDQVKFLAL